MNPLFQMMMGGNTPVLNNISGFMNALNNLKRTFHGDPQQYIQSMLNSGRISQEQYNREYNRAVQIAQQIQGMFK